MLSSSTVSVRLKVCAGICALMLANQVAFAQTSTKILNFNGGTGFSGSISGDITATVKSQNNAGTIFTQGLLDVLDLDIDLISNGGFGNAFPDGDSRNNTASTAINIAPSVIGINIPSTPFASPVSGSMTVTAGDNLANGVVGAIDAGVPGSDGAWDDPGQTGILNGATVDSFSAALDNDIDASVNVTGGLAASIPSDITIPDIVDTGFLGVDLRLKNSSTVSVDFTDVQNLQIKDLTFSSSTPVGLVVPESNFVEAAHPTGIPQLDLSAGGGGLVETIVTGTLSADLLGTVFGSLDLAADLSLIGIVNFSIDIDDVIDGALSDPDISLLSLNEAISLPDVELPFSFAVLHEATVDVDFDDVLGAMQTTTFGLDLPVQLLEEDVVLDIPMVEFELGTNGPSSNPELSFEVDEGFLANGVVELEHLLAQLSGQAVLDLEADLLISADLFSTAFQASAINVVPEPSSMMLAAMSGLALAGYCIRRRKK